MKSSLTVVSLCAAIALAATVSFAQPSPDTLWTQICGGSANDYGYAVQQTTDGGYVAAGITESYGAGLTDFYVVKLNSQGDTLWTHTYGGSGYDYALSVQQTSDGGYIVAGFTGSYGAGGYDFWLVKINDQGDSMWACTYGGTDYDKAYSVQQTTDGGYIAAGCAQCDGGIEHFYLVKTNSQGALLWSRNYGVTDGDKAFSVQQTTDGGYIVAGVTNEYGSNSDFYVVKTTNQGDTLWTRRYGGSSMEWARSVRQTYDGGYIVAGYTAGYTNTGCYLVKTDSRGDTLWTRTYGGSGSHVRVYSVRQTTDGGYLMAGNVNGTHVHLIRTDAQGDTLWTRSYYRGWTEAYSAQPTADGGYVVVGYTALSVNAADLYVVKTGPEVPSRVVIAFQDEYPVLNWSPTGSPFYCIYGATSPDGSGSLLVTVSDTTWRDADFASRPSPFFYYVTAAVSP